MGLAINGQCEASSGGIVGNMGRMGKETRRMLCWLLAVCLAAAAGLGILLFYMTNDFQKTMVEHDYGTAGYLVNHPDTNAAAAF